MKKFLLLAALFICFVGKSFGQAQRIIGPAEQRITDSLCIALSKIDTSKIKNPQEAESAFMNAFTQLAPMLQAVADERKISTSDQEALRKMGIDIGKNLLNEKCDGFLKLTVKMASEATGKFTEGTFKRIDNKGFNFIVVVDNTGAEKSFLWLRKFPNSDRFMNNASDLIGKRIRIDWHETEAYSPQNKEYYMAKEILRITIL